MNPTPPEARSQIVNLVREFVRRDVEPVARQYDDEDTYPQELVDKMATMGLFGITIPEEYGGASTSPVVPLPEPGRECPPP